MNIDFEIPCKLTLLLDNSLGVLKQYLGISFPFLQQFYAHLHVGVSLVSCPVHVRQVLQEGKVGQKERGKEKEGGRLAKCGEERRSGECSLCSPPQLGPGLPSSPGL